MVNSKKKGNRGEAELVKAFKDWWGDDSFQRNLESGATATLMEQRGAPADVIARLSGDILTPVDFPYCVEVKTYKEVDLYACIRNPDNSLITQWWNQCKNDAERAQKMAMLVFKEDRKPRYAIFPRGYLINLVGAGWTQVTGKGSIDLHIKLDQLDPFGNEYDIVTAVLLSEFIEVFPKDKLLNTEVHKNP